MVISSKVEITVLALKEQKSKDGTKTYYRLAVFDQINCESGMLPCSEEVAKLWQNKGFKSMDHVELGCEFNDRNAAAIMYGITSSTAGAICHLSSILPITISCFFGRNLVRIITAVKIQIN